MKSALLVIDVQNDFITGSLGSEGNIDIINVINSIRNKFDKVVFTKDWHPSDHISFHENNPNSVLFEEFLVPIPNSNEKRSQTMWPTHCVQFTDGAKLHQELEYNESDDWIWNKGTETLVESYSPCEDCFGNKSGFMQKLKDNSYTNIYVCGIALEICVRGTCVSLSKEGGFNVTLIRDAVASVNKEKEKSTLEELENLNINIINSDEINL